MKTITPSQLNERLKKGEKLQLLDVRTPAEYAKVHVPVVHLAPLDRLDPTQLADVNGFAPDALTTTTRSVMFPEVPALLANVTRRGLLDVRKAMESAAAHLRDAQNIAHTRLLPRLNEVFADLPLLVHCASGLRAVGACAFLSRAGRENICIADAFDNAPKALLA